MTCRPETNVTIDLRSGSQGDKKLSEIKGERQQGFYTFYLPITKGKMGRNGYPSRPLYVIDISCCASNLRERKNEDSSYILPG